MIRGTRAIIPGLTLALVVPCARAADPAPEIDQWTIADGLPSNGVNSMAETPDGSLWMGTNGGLVRFDGLSFEVFDASTNPEFLSHRVTALRVTNDGTLWIGCEMGGILRHDGGRFTHAGPGSEGLFTIHEPTLVERGSGRFAVLAARGAVPPPDLLDRMRSAPWFQNVATAYFDSRGQLWCGTRQLGVYRLRAAAFERLEVGHKFQGCQIAPDGTGGLWFGPHREAGLFHWVDGAVTEKVAADGPSRVEYVYGLLRARDGTIWVQHGDVVTALRGDRATVLDLGRRSYRAGLMVEGIDGAIWCAVGEGLCRIEPDDGTLHWYGAEEGFDNTLRISGLGVTHAGLVWVGSHTAIYRWDGTRLTQFDADDGVPRGFVRAFCETSDGSLWVGSYGGGLARLVDGRFTVYTTRDGLPDNSISATLEDDRGNVWMNTNHGAAVVRLDALLAHEPGVSSQLPIRLIESGEARGPGGCFTGEDLVVFPTISGVVAIDMSRALASPMRPPVARIERLDAGGAPADLAATVVIPAERRDLDFRFTAADLHDPAGLRFRHRLAGYDDGWIEAGTRRHASFTRVPPGRYVFEVIATDSAGQESEAASLALTIEPFFYERRLFTAAVIVAALAVVCAAYWLRVRMITARNRALVAEIDERTRVEAALRESRGSLRALSTRLLTVQDEERRGIARELHDDVTQRLAALAIEIGVMARRASFTDEHERQKASSSARAIENLATDIQQISRRLHPASLRELGLVPAMRSECAAFSKREGIPVRFDAEDPPVGLSPDVTLAAFRILQESLRNIARHARAADVRVSVGVAAEDLSMDITDAGRGFDPEDGDRAGGGIGLITMSERADAVGGRLFVDSRPGGGTVVRLRVPLNGSDS